MSSEIFVQSLAQAYANKDEERSSGLLNQVPNQTFELVRQAVTLELNKQGQEDVKQRFKKDCEVLEGSPSVSKSRLAHSQFFSEESSSKTENKSTGTRLRDSIFFTRSSEPSADETEGDKKDKQRCQESYLTKN